MNQIIIEGTNKREGKISQQRQVVFLLFCKVVLSLLVLVDVHQVLGKDKQMLSQAVVCSNVMKPNADCVPQHRLKEIGHSSTAPSQLFVPSEGMKNRCP